MPKYDISQSYNNGSKKSFLSIDTDLATAEAIVAMMPDGVSSFTPDANGATGTPRPVPSQYVEALATCKDTADPTAKPSFVGVRFGKDNLSDDDIVTALSGTIKLTSGVACDAVAIKKYNLIGAVAASAV